MTDVIREAFEALERLMGQVVVPFGSELDVSDEIDTIKAALQSAQGAHPAPVAVPEGWKEKVLELCSAVENDDDLPPVKYALKCGRLINEVKDMLTAAPSPAQSVDEIQAGALEDFADVQATKAEQWRHKGSLTNEQFHIDCAEQAYEQAARLRQSGNAGDDGEGKSHG